MGTRKTAIYFGHSTAIVQSREVERIIRSNFDVVFASHFDFGDRVDQEKLARLGADFLFSFGPLLVREPLLNSIVIAPINFHPAPPRWPGRGSAAMAIMEGDADFGVTAHVMVKEIDAGPILKVRRFSISEVDEAQQVKEKGLRCVPRLVRSVVEDLRKNGWRPQPNGDTWERKAIKKADVEALIRSRSGDRALITGQMSVVSAR